LASEAKGAPQGLSIDGAAPRGVAADHGISKLSLARRSAGLGIWMRADPREKGPVL
jgi:hypothetical protein